MAQLSVTKCTICERNNKKVYCYECQQFLCQTCEELHNKFPGNKRHTVTADIDRSAIALKYVKLTCEQHEREYVHYCLECECLICSLCVTSIHKGHSFGDISKVASDERQVIAERIVELKSKVQKITDMINEIRTTKTTNIESESENFTKEVHEISGYFLSIINEVTEINITRASDHLVLEKQHLEYILAKLENVHKEYTSLLDRSENILNEKHDVMFFLNYKTLRHEIEGIEGIPDATEANQIEDFNKESFVDAIIERILNRYSISIVNQAKVDVDTMKMETERLESEMRAKCVEFDEIKEENRRLNGKLLEMEAKYADLEEIKEEKKRLDGKLVQMELKCWDLEEIITETIRQMFTMASRSPKKLVAAIDIGTTYSGYAFSFRSDFKEDPCKFFSHSWTASGRLKSLKTPTYILLNPQKEFECFGHDAEDRYTELVADDLHHDWYYFRRFKMILYDTLRFNLDVKVKTVDEKKELPALTIFSMAIKFFKDHLMDNLDKRNTHIRLDDIQWVLTVPAIWNDPAKHFMREAAEKAGIPNENLLIASEPEAVSMFCRFMPVKREANLHQIFRPGSKYIVLDCGGLTLDVTVYKVKRYHSLTEVYKANIGACGGTQVDEAFTQLIIKIIGNHIFLKFKEENAADFVTLYKEFEVKKRVFKGDGNTPITIKIPISLKETFERETGETIQDAVDQSAYSTKLKWVGDKLRINSTLFTTLFDIATGNIVEHVKQLLKEPKILGTSNIIMVGEVSESPFVQAKVKEAFPNMTVIIPEEADLAVLKGAVIFGQIC